VLCKTGTNANGVQPPTWYAVGVAEVVYKNHGMVLVVTSLTDGVHPDKKNIHGLGLAADIRTRDIPTEVLAVIFKELVEILDPLGYDIVIELSHIHMEYDPKGVESWSMEYV
jgi:hypothetical protein